VYKNSPSDSTMSSRWDRITYGVSLYKIWWLCDII
jgi:hypothetical protein